jgi:hypothetical protein
VDNRFYVGDFGDSIFVFLGTQVDGGPDLSGSDTLVYAEVLKPRLAFSISLVYSGGSFFDQSFYLTDDFWHDLRMLPNHGVAAGDAVYFGSPTRFGAIDFNIRQAGVGNWAVAWEYYTAGGWVSLPNADDSTDAFRVAGKGRVSWDWVLDWKKVALNSKGPFFFARARVTTGDAAYTTQPKADDAHKGPSSHLLEVVDLSNGETAMTVPSGLLDEEGVFRVQTFIREGNHAATRGLTTDIEVLPEFAY